MYQLPNYPLPFKVKDNSLYYCAKNKDGYSEQLVCNFWLWVVREINYDNGAESSSRVTIEGIHHTGRPLQPVELPSGDALRLEWVQDKWGMDCIIENQSRVKKALQTTADSSNREYVYGITGWRKFGDRWEFLMPGDEKITVRLEDKLRRYGMERSFTQQDMEIAVQLLRKPPAAEEVFWPLLAFVFLSPLNHFLEMAGHEPKFVMLLQGKTGSRKSTLAALVLSFFGKFTATSLPMSFRDTANYTLSNAFALKDVLTCIDDFHPTGRQEEGKLTNIAQTIMRAYGDRTGRGRLRQDCSAMASRPPQGNAIITAEMAPNIGESGTARYFSLELKERDVDLRTLSAFQKEADSGTLQKCMYGYIQWLKNTYLCDREMQNLFVLTLRKKFEAYRDDFRNSGVQCHGRVPEMVAWLRIGMEMFLNFLVESHCLDADSSKYFEEEFFSILCRLAVRQADNIIQDKPTRKFIRNLYALMDAGQATVMPKNGNHDWIPNTNVGYEDDTFLYLHSEVAYQKVRKFCDDQGESFSLTCKALLKSLAEEGYIDTCGTQNTKSIRIDGKSKRLLCLYKDKAQQVLGED